MPARRQAGVEIAFLGADLAAARVQLAVRQQAPAVQAEGDPQLLLDARVVVRVHPQLRLAVEHRFLLDQLLDLRQQGSAVAHRRLAQHLFGGGQCQLHQPRSDHAVERVQRVLEFGDQLLPVGGQRLLLLLRFQQPLLAAFLQSGLKTGLIAFCWPSA